MEQDLEERMEHLTTSDQILDSCGKETMKMGFTSMVSINIFSPWDLIDNDFQSNTHEQIHEEVIFILGHGEKCSLKEKLYYFSFEVHFDSFIGGTKDLRFDKNELSVLLMRFSLNI